MVKLRHLKAEKLEELERMIGEIKLPVTLTGNPQLIGDLWYAHFLVQGIQEERQPSKVEVSEKTKTIDRR